ncbi:trinucleotide repeat-containing gene 6B protein isoform X1 [Bombina bombina]|uniref:trinucleotide repeat-containing gene 6B protein isoform X1 n=2 Tax=Bombina bombina TaxID=8345 RepID=UPI00235A974C|nr:trinucleotide repeat-containing gene 6B protein isoform X1 [Bombina bombina]
MREKHLKKAVPRDKEQEREEQLMEDKKRKKEDKKKKESAQKVTEQKTKVPEVTKPSSSQATAASLPGSSPSPPVNGGNNAKRVAVPNGQPPTTARYMPREVPPRFRCQQDHKVLLKRGQPPPASCMLLGSGAGTPSSSATPGAVPGNAQPGAGALLQGESGPATDSSSGAAATSNYANSTWGSGAPSSSGPSANPPHAWDKVIVDGSDMEEWPCIAGVDAEPPSDNATDNNSASNPASEKGPPQGSATSHKGRGGQVQQQQPGGECIQGVWKSDTKAKPVPSSNPTTEGTNRLGNWRSVGGSERTGPASGFSNFNPNTNPSAWPALVQEGGRKGNPEPEGSFSGAQLGPAGQTSREQQSKMENAGAGFAALGREPATTHHTDGPKNGNTNSTNSNTSTPPENKGTAFGVGSGEASRGSDPPAQSTGDRKNGGVNSWGATRGPSATGDATCGHGNSGSNGREREDARKGSSHRPNGSRGDSWDSKSGGNGSWGYGPQGDPSEVKWGEGNKLGAGGASQGDWKQAAGHEDLKVGEWGGPSQGNSSTGAWDNQKGHLLSESQGNPSSAACWGRAPSSTGSEAGGQSTGSNPKTGGSGDSLNSSNRRVHRSALPDCQAALQTMLSRTDLDPRVLSNTGWGQTQIKQDASWESEEASSRAEGKADRGTEGWENTPQAKSSGGWGDAPSQSNQNKSGWGEPSVSAPSAQEWKDTKTTGWNDYKSNATGWGGAGGPGAGAGGRPEEKAAPGWNNDNSSAEPGWGTRQPNPASGWSAGKNGWGGTGGGNEDMEPPKGQGGWDGSGNKTSSGWGEVGQNDVGSWGNGANPNQAPRSGWDENKRPQGGGGGWGEAARPPLPWNKQEATPAASSPGSWGNPQAPPPPGNGRPQPNPGWKGGPQPTTPKEEEPSGWEEPTPQPITRKMDIDDGTAAWGDPSNYNYKNVSLWDKNAQVAPGQIPREQSIPGSLANKAAPSVWNKKQGPPADNGTSAWGDPNEPASGWGEGEDTGPPNPGWGNTPPVAPSAMKTGTKSMQDGWGESEGGVSGTRHSSWEEEEEGGGVWNNAGSQGSGSSHNSAGWGQGGKKPQIKGSLKGGNNDSWINPLSKQFSNMGLLSQVDDQPASKMDHSVGGLPEKKFEADKRGVNLGDFNDMMRKDRPGFRLPNSKEMGAADSGPYFEKGGSHGLFGNSGAQSRGMHNPMPSLNSSPNLRAQVPPQFLSPQVSASMLKQFPNSNMSPGLFNMGPQLSPQQIAMLSQLPQIQQFQLACQLLLQQQQQQQQLLQNQRKISQAVRQQQEQQQLARMVSALQQQQQRQPGMKHSPSHPAGPKSHMDGMGLSDMQAKGHMPGYSSGFGSSGIDYSMVGKEAAAESRFKQWTSMMDGLPSSQESALHKNGSIVPPGKNRGGSPYNQYDMMSGDPLVGHGGPAGDSWLPAKSPPSNKIGNKSINASWPPEFQPGVPWKGIQNIDPESDPYVTPGSVLGGPAPSPIVDTDHQLLQDTPTGSNSSLNTSLPSHGAWPYSASDNIHSTSALSAKFGDYKSTWSPDPIGHNPSHHSNKMWKNPMSRNSPGLPRPPPGLTNNPKANNSPWNSTASRSVRGWSGQESRLASASSWSDGASVRPSYWLILLNLTPQIDGSTLRTICMQHGPLLTFHLNLTQGTALIRYNTKQEAAKAQSALHMCVLGNTTILAEFATDEEVNRYFAQAQPQAPSAPGAGWQPLEVGQNHQAEPVGPALNLFGGTTGLGQWSSGGGSSDLSGVSLWGTPSYTSSLWGVPSTEDAHRMGSPAPLLPGDLLGGGTDSI